MGGENKKSQLGCEGTKIRLLLWCIPYGPLSNRRSTEASVAECTEGSGAMLSESCTYIWHNQIKTRTNKKNRQTDPKTTRESYSGFPRGTGERWKVPPGQQEDNEPHSTGVRRMLGQSRFVFYCTNALCSLGCQCQRCVCHKFSILK